MPTTTFEHEFDIGDFVVFKSFDSAGVHHRFRIVDVTHSIAQGRVLYSIRDTLGVSPELIEGITEIELEAASVDQVREALSNN